MSERRERRSEPEFIRRVLITIGIAGLAAAVYLLSDVILLIFGAILVAVVLRTLARPIQAGTSMGERLALLASALVVAALLIGTGYLFGSQIRDQLISLSGSLPEAAQSLARAFPNATLPDLLKGSSLAGLLTNAFTWGTTIFGALASLVIVLVAGIYIAIKPRVYRDGFLMLFPKQRQAEIADTLDAAGEALRLWLGGQVLAMVIVGVLVALGLSLVGVPSPLALGVIAGMTEFVPIAGPVLGAIPALLLASTQGWHTVGWTLLVFLVVQQLESNVIMPLIAGRVVALAPAVGLFAVIVMGVLFGPLGLLPGYPLAVATHADKGLSRSRRA
jgi:predicted PurR-regulated permease PerM